jgi:chromosome segregation ATPase
MTLDGGWGLIIATVIGVVMVWIGTLVQGHFGHASTKGESAHARVDDLEEQVTVNEKEFLRFQTHVAENYAKHAQMERLENNIFSALTRLEVKVDGVKDKLNGDHHG